MVDLMLADGEITPMRLRGKLVRFYLPDVLQELREKAKTSKRGVTRRVQPRMNTDGHGFNAETQRSKDAKGERQKDEGQKKESANDTN
jgi:hypothetical protein